MKTRLLLPALGIAAFAVASPAQTLPRQAAIRGGGNPNEGKCTIEVVVDGAAQVEIRGSSAQLVNLKGQPPQWRRFECTSAMPSNPEGFRFQGVDGRGRQQLVREPRNGSPAVVEIGDPDNGSEGYTFDIMWGNNRGGGYQPGPPDARQGYGAPVEVRPGYGRGSGRGNFSADQAVSVCQDNVRRQAAARFRTNEIVFRRTTIDDNPGRNDWVVGSMEVRSPRQGDQVMRFSCSVDFATGQVRTATIEAPGTGGYAAPDRGPEAVNVRAMRNCERQAQQKIEGQGFDRVSLGTSRFDTDRGPRVMGDLRAYGRNGAESFRFSCSVDPRDGDVQSVEVFPRDDRR